MSIGADTILLHAAGVLQTVPGAKQIGGFEATCSALAELDAAFPDMVAAKVEPLAGLHQGVFDRVADSAGLDDGVGLAHSGTSVVQIANSSVHSDECADKRGGLTDTQIVTELYQSFRNRDRDGKAAAKPTAITLLSRWVAEISAGRPLETTSAEG